jgi:protocatechuate 3,4-dioxygenase beta subunit
LGNTGGGSSGTGGGGSTGGGSAGGGTGGGTGGGASTGGGTGYGGGGSGTGSWAIGDGTFLTGKTYGDPFSTGIGTSCVVYKAATQGPCHSNTFDRQELTEGYVGLPTRLELLVVDASCNPVPDATVEIWHASPGGKYSGAPVNGQVGSDLNTAFCTGNDAAALSAGWFRGYQTAGSDGRVTFDTLFPGWYSGRAWHIHFKVTVGTTAYITSQLFADETLKANVFGTHSSYSSRPITTMGYVTNSSDMVVSQSGLVLSDVVLDYAMQSDGAMLMWKAITVS